MSLNRQQRRAMIRRAGKDLVSSVQAKTIGERVHDLEVATGELAQWRDGDFIPKWNALIQLLQKRGIIEPPRTAGGIIKPSGADIERVQEETRRDG